MLELDLGLQGFLSTAVELVVPGLVVPGLGAPGLTVPGVVAPSWVIAGLVAAPHGKVTRSIHQTSLVIGREPRVLRCCRALLKEKGWVK